MTDFTSITDWSFQFPVHLHCKTYHATLNDIYSEPLEPAVVDNLFTTVAKTTVTPNAIATIRAGIVNTIRVTSTADRIVIVPIINQMLIFATCGTPTKRFPIRSPATFTAALNATIAAVHATRVIRFSTTLIYVDCNNFDAMIFTGISLTGPICDINFTVAGTDPGVVGAATYAAATVPTPAQVAAAAIVTANAANQALVAQQTAAASALAVTLSYRVHLK